jgi:uncharacterized protein
VRYEFEWDPKKAKRNVEKHRVSFERAASLFNDPGAISIFDEAHSDKEERWITLGRDRTGSVIVVCHTFQQHLPLLVRIRIISARKATKKEKNIYVASEQ